MDAEYRSGIQLDCDRVYCLPMSRAQTGAQARPVSDMTDHVPDPLSKSPRTNPTSVAKKRPFDDSLTAS